MIDPDSCDSGSYFDKVEEITELESEIERLRADLALAERERDSALHWLNQGPTIIPKLTVKHLEPIVTKAKQAYIDAVTNNNYTGFEEHFLAAYIARALLDEII